MTLKEIKREEDALYDKAKASVIDIIRESGESSIHLLMDGNGRIPGDDGYDDTDVEEVCDINYVLVETISLDGDGTLTLAGEDASGENADDGHIYRNLNLMEDLLSRLEHMLRK